MTPHSVVTLARRPSAVIRTVLSLAIAAGTVAACRPSAAPDVQVESPPSVTASPGTIPSASTAAAAMADLPSFVATTPKQLARLASTVAEVRVREVRTVAAMADHDMRGATIPTDQSGRLVVMDIVRLLKPEGPAAAATLDTFIAVVPDALDPSLLLPHSALPDLYPPRTEAVAFLLGYDGPGDADCAALRASIDPNHNQALCGFALPYVLQGEKAVDPLTGQGVPRTELEAAIAAASQPRRPGLPYPWPEAWSFGIVDGIYLGIEGSLEMDNAVVAEVEVVREGPPEYNTPKGAAPPGPPDETGTPHVDRDDWDIRQLVELKVHHVFAGDPRLMDMTDIVTLVPGEPDNPYHPMTGMEPPPLPAGMRGVVAFDDDMWPQGDPTYYQRRALDRVAALNVAGRRARLLTAQPGAATYFVGPYAFGDGGFKRIADYRAELDRLGR